MLVSDTYKFVYMPPPKTGTTSIIEFLTKKYDAYIWTQWSEEVYNYNNIKIKHPKHIIHLPKQLKDYYVFGSVRNPYTREISRYLWKILKNNINISFKDYIDDIKKEQNSDWFYLRQNEEYEPPKNCIKFKLNSFIQLENIIDDIQKLPFIKEQVDIPMLNVTCYNKSLKYTTTMIKKIINEFEIDFEKFKYEKNWIPLL